MMKDSGLNWRVAPPDRQAPAKAFLPLLRTAVAAHPDRRDLLRDLVVALRDDRRWQEIANILTPLERAGALSGELALELGMAAGACEEWARAQAALDIAVAKGVPGAWRQAAFLHDQQNDAPRALEAALAALAEDPRDADALGVAARRLLDQDGGERLLVLCDDLWRRGGGNASLLAWRGAALTALEREDATALIDYDVWCARITLPPGTVDHDRLAETVLGHGDIAQSSAYKPTAGRNLRLEQLASRSEPPIVELLALIREQVDAYVAARRRLDHPVMALRPNVAQLQGWALAVMDDGHELMHIHPGGWLTAVYYVQTPRGAGDGAGSILFGPWPPALEERLPAYPRRRITPQAGDLLIFPSFMGHSTAPTGVADTRLCMVLDVVPCAS